MKHYQIKLNVYETSDGLKFGEPLEKDINLWYLGNNAEAEAIEHEESLSRIVDKNIKHDFQEGELVYVAFNDAVRTCRITSISEEVESQYEEHSQRFIEAKITIINLVDLCKAENDITKYYTFRDKQVNSIKRKVEELIAPVVNYAD